MPESLEDICESGEAFLRKRFKACWSQIETSSSLTIGDKPLSNRGWNSLLKFLFGEDLSCIKHLVLDLRKKEIPPFTEPPGYDFSVEGYCPLWPRGQPLVFVFGSLFRSGKFSTLETLKIVCADESSRGRLIVDELERLIVDELDRREDGLHCCAVCILLGALIKGTVSQLTSFSLLYPENMFSDSFKTSSCSRELEAILKSGCFKHLEHLTLSNWFAAQPDAWHILLTRGIDPGLLPHMKSMCLSRSSLQGVWLADLVSLIWFGSLEKLSMDSCGITSKQVCVLVDAVVKVVTAGLALKILNLSGNKLESAAVGALLRLASSDLLFNLEELDLSKNGKMVSSDLKSLLKIIKKGHLPMLQTLDWRGNRVNDGVAGAIAQAYFENEHLTTNLIIDWVEVSDVSLKTKAAEYRDRNLRLVALKEKHKEELREVLPLTCSKVFLCGFPEVGKTKLRRTLCRHLSRRTRFIWETHPNLFKEPRTKGIELSRIEEQGNNGNNMALVLWDLAGQEEFHVLHGTFLADLGLAGGKATTFVLVFRSQIEKDSKQKLLYWLRFVASSSLHHVKRHVVIVLNRFDGKQCTESDKDLWLGLIEEFEKRFHDKLDIRLEPFIIDVRAASLAKELKDHLFSQARKLLQNVEVPRVCFELQQELKVWSASDKERHLPILSWEAFEKEMSLKHKQFLVSGTELKAAASYLHEIGEIIYFDEKDLTQSGSKNRCIVVPNPEWFCRRVVGQLLLPKNMLEGDSSILVNADGSILISYFQSFFRKSLVEGTQIDDVISMLERVGLCYRTSEVNIIVPALIRRDDYNSLDWEGKGFHGVMGRCLATADMERSVIPETLFRRLQVDLAQDPSLGGRGDSGYRAGRSFSNFRVGEVLVLIQFDLDHSDPTDDRIDFLTKSLRTGDPRDVSLVQVEILCRIQHKLEILCVSCCPGITYDIKVVQPWRAADKTPKMTPRILMSLREIKDLMIKGENYTGWLLNGNPVELNTFLSGQECQEVLDKRTQACEITFNQEYDECERDAVSLGLLTEGTLQKFKESEGQQTYDTLNVLRERETWIPEEGSDFQDGGFSNRIYHAIQELKDIVRGEGHHIRQHVDKKSKELLLEIQNKHGHLVRLIQAQESFSVEEKESSVPRYLFLAPSRGKSQVWISLREAFRSTFTLHLLCEAHFDDGFLHEVKGQLGIELRKNKEWFEKISPWLKRSLQVALFVFTIVGKAYLPGFPNLLPNNISSNDKRASAKAVDIAAAMLLEDQESNQVQDGHGDCSTAAEPRNLKERLIAQEIVKDLISALGHANFAKMIGLRKVILRAAPKPHVGSSDQIKLSVAWICDECYVQYGESATDITPRV